MVLVLLALFSGLSFVAYGYSTLFGDQPKDEFERYGIPTQRRFVGSMQLLGAFGVLLGLAIAPLGAAAAAGLVIMMAMALIVRRKIGDPVHLMAPATFFLTVNAILVILFLNA